MYIWFLAEAVFAVCVRPDDGLLEVMALYSSFHIAQMQVGLVEPLRLGQARVVKVGHPLCAYVCLFQPLTSELVDNSCNGGYDTFLICLCICNNYK